MSVTIRSSFKSKAARRAEKPERAPTVPRSARLMALAIVLDEMVRAGEFESYAEIARLAGLTRARVSQVMDLLALAPEIQAGLLVVGESVGAREIRLLAGTPSWRLQRGSIEGSLSVS